MSVIRSKPRLDEPVTEDVLRRAADLGALRSRSLHATEVRYAHDSKTFNIGFVDKTAIMLPVEIYPEFSTLSLVERRRVALGFAGTALCLESRDLHVSIAGLVAASAPLMEMAATVIASRNGSRSTLAKAAASRENGRRGGRPRSAIQAASRTAPVFPEPGAAISQGDLYVERRSQGDYAVRKADARRASAVEPTQAEAIERARELNPNAAVYVKRVRVSAGGHSEKWRKL